MKVAENTLAPHDRGLALDEHHRARGRVCPRGDGPGLSRGRAGRLHLDRRAHAGGKIPIVRQYRPAIEAFSWELPAGLVDPGESPAEGCRRELLEETGLTVRAIHRLGDNSPAPDASTTASTASSSRPALRAAGFQPEPGITLKLVSPAEIRPLDHATATSTRNCTSARCCSPSSTAFSTLPRKLPANAAPRRAPQGQAESRPR